MLLYGQLTTEQEIKLGVYLAGEILPRRSIVVTDPGSGIVGRFQFHLECVEDDQVANSGYVPLTADDIRREEDGSETVRVTVQISPKMYLRIPQTGAPWSKLLIFLGPRLKQPIADLFPDESTRNSEAWIIQEIHQALELIGGIQEALTRQEPLEKLPKLFQSLGLKANPVFFSHLRMERILEGNRVAGEYKFIGLKGDGAGELTENDLQGLLTQGSGLKQLEVVRPDDEGGKLEFALITGWKGGTLLMLPQKELLPAWAERPLAGIQQVYCHNNADDINFTAEEKAAYNTADFLSKKFQPAYVLILRVGGDFMEAAYLGRQNNGRMLPDSLVRLPWDAKCAPTHENFVARMVWAARWSLARVSTIHPDEVVKAGIYFDDAGQWPSINKEMAAKEIKSALAEETAPRISNVEVGREACVA